LKFNGHDKIQNKAKDKQIQYKTKEYDPLKLVAHSFQKKTPIFVSENCKLVFGPPVFSSTSKKKEIAKKEETKIKMDPAEEIAELKREIADMKKKLEQTDISEAREIAIREQICEYTKAYTALIGLAQAQTASASAAASSTSTSAVAAIARTQAIETATALLPERGT
jgi:hypothetical protein